jgi:signal transduction histidine kinase
VRNRHHRDSFLLASDLASFRRQESTFILINVSLLAILFVLQSVFASYWGNPSKAMVFTVSAGVILKCAELIWLHTVSPPLSWTTKVLLTWASATLNTALVLVLTILNGHENSPYFVLMIIPILEMAFRSRFLVVLGMVAIGSFLNVFFVWYYFKINPPLDVGEYFEAGTSSLIFLIVGVVVWVLVNHLRENEARLGESVRDLQDARERLLEEERLAAVGRLSSAIAHEIRNPVAMISSSLATATHGDLDPEEREEMFSIAAKESDRLVTLTTDFLAYARPRPPALTRHPISETLQYVASVCRARAGEKNVAVAVTGPADLEVLADAGQIQQAVLNLLMNALDASPANALVRLRAFPDGQNVRINIENSGESIPERNVSRIFEPFFSTKPSGSGLGLAIARNIARAHGGELCLSTNEPQQVCFSLILPVPPAPADEAEKERWVVS